MTWKELYRMSIELGPGGAQQLMRRCHAALAASRDAQLKRAVHGERGSSLFALCDALDEHGEAATEDPFTPCANTRPSERPLEVEDNPLKLPSASA